ncbi:ATP-binding cassette transporter [Klebsormidium nitens]|uniref:ATP-binding cassette transporter n=1 Tax=Klebsormidium nitens TaxID=105231 RepID=A0A1Y1HP97_KLENI|nr:ATP-binding cassette transporter [Klebsormidium nitens]|eukprot:GAQ79029.1 ATP-binding cassette transporter [Klebsormidium nitens]
MQLLSRFLRVGRAFFQGDAKWRAWGLTALMLALCGVTTGLFVVLSYTQRDFSTALSQKDQPAFWKAVSRFLGILVVATPLFAVYDYVQDLLALEWREWMTNLLVSNYFARRAFFDLKLENTLDNPDQRICDDVRNFVGGSVGLVVFTTNKILNSIAFTGVLWSVSPELVIFLLAYSIIGTLVALKIFGKKMVHLQYEALARQADFRYSMVRVRENAESIAFYRGEERELHSVSAFVRRMIAVLRHRIVWSRHLSLFGNAYEYATLVIPSVIIAPRYFAGQIEFGVVTQAGMAFRAILSALTVLVAKFLELSELAAGTERLDALILALAKHSGDRRLATHEQVAEEEAGPRNSAEEDDEERALLLRVTEGGPSRIAKTEGPGLILKDVSISTPDRRQTLFENLNLTLLEGQSLMVTGPSGCGKSSLLRAIAGLWNAGSGEISCPPAAQTFFLPQKPYMPLGSLRQQLLFPKDESHKLRPADEELITALEEVHLGSLAEKVGGLGAVCDWSDMLSSGEQQRVAFARLLLQEPQVAFLDESSSALDSANEAHLYSLLQRRIHCYVSVGHRLSLVKYHTHVLQFTEGSGWRLQTSQAFQRQMAV